MVLGQAVCSPSGQHPGRKLLTLPAAGTGILKEGVLALPVTDFPVWLSNICIDVFISAFRKLFFLFVLFCYFSVRGEIYAGEQSARKNYTRLAQVTQI